MQKFLKEHRYVPADVNNNFLLVKETKQGMLRLKQDSQQNWGLFLTGSGNNLLFEGFSSPPLPRSAP